MSDDTAASASGETPAKPQMSNGVKAAILLLVTMGLILAAGFIFVVAVMVKRNAHPAPAATIGLGGRFGVSDIHVAPGETVKTVVMNDDRIAIHTVTVKQGAAALEEIIVVDARTGVELGRIRLRPLSDFAENVR